MSVRRRGNGADAVGSACLNWVDPSVDDEFTADDFGQFRPKRPPGVFDPGRPSPLSSRG